MGKVGKCESLNHRESVGMKEQQEADSSGSKASSVTGQCQETRWLQTIT